jgi:restriction system protein
LRQLDPALFEDRIADLFNVQGYEAHAVGGSRDRGIDVVISRPDGTPWAVAQCKRYGFANRVSSSEIVHFCGAFHLSRAQCGFFFTTGGYTKEARRCAEKMPWLKTHDGKSLVELILNTIAGQGSDSEVQPS